MKAASDILSTLSGSMATLDPKERAALSLSCGEDSRWQEVWRLVIEAERQPAAERRDFILAAGTDSFVNGQAIAILEGGDSVLSYSSTPGPDALPLSARVGMNFGRYRVGTLLGSGATGSVYAGFDQELNRAVAIKFFPPGSQAKAGVQSRPMREARAASALNHPNIIMIHEVIEAGNAAAIVMELVSGVTFRTLAGTGPRLRDILESSVQLASALAVAHSNGLVHGDIKPENVMVRDDGYVKLLDFGLAAALSDNWTGRNTSLTGTPRYLSPEQCLGEPATQASDIFSFGVMLYELTTGQHPFESDGMLVLLRAIISADPPAPIAVNPKLPRALNLLILRMLSKHSQDRPTAAETAKELDLILARLTRGPVVGKRAAALTMGTVAIAAAAGLLYFASEPRAAVDLSRMNVRPMAAQPGLETNPSLSPDGAWISCTYKVRSNDRPQFQVHATRGGPPLALDTGDLVVEESASWSPDSHDLAFVGRDHLGKRAIYRISRTGGPVTKLFECPSGGCGFDWSADGRFLAVISTPPAKSSDELFLVDLATGRRLPSLLQPTHPIWSARFSPNGKWIAFVRMTSYTNQDLCMIPSNGGPVQCATRRPWFLAGFAWSRDSKSLVAMSGQRADRPQMWQFPIDGQFEPFRLATFDFGRNLSLSVSRGKGSAAWVRDMTAENIWLMPLSGADQRAELLVGSAAIDTDAEWSRQGRIVFRSDRSGFNEIWISRGDGSGQVQATRYQGPFVGDAHWSPDGRQLAFTAHPDGNADIFTVSCDGDGPEACGTPKQLTRSPAADANPTWSSDGSSLYFSSNRSGSFEVWKVASGGGKPVRVTQNGGYMARESADGKWLYYSKVVRGNGFWRIPLISGDTGQQEQAVIPAAPYKASATWALGAHVLYFYPSEEESPGRLASIRAVDLETLRVRDLPTAKKVLGRGLSLSPDGKSLLYTIKDRFSSSIMIAE